MTCFTQLARSGLDGNVNGAGWGWRWGSEIAPQKPLGALLSCGEAEEVSADNRESLAMPAGRANLKPDAEWKKRYWRRDH